MEVPQIEYVDDEVQATTSVCADPIEGLYVGPNGPHPSTSHCNLSLALHMPMQTDDKSSHNHVLWRGVCSHRLNRFQRTTRCQSSVIDRWGSWSTSKLQSTTNLFKFDLSAEQVVRAPPCPPPHCAIQVNFGSAPLFGITLRITETVRAMSTSNFTPGRQNDHVFRRVNHFATLHCSRSLCLCRFSARWRLPLAVLVYTATVSIYNYLIDISMQTGMWHPNSRPSGWLVLWSAAKEKY